MARLEGLDSLKVSTGWIEIEILSEPDVVLAYKGYAPVLVVKAIRRNLEYRLHISAKSLATPFEELRQQNRGKFTGLKLKLRKKSTDQYAQYEVQGV